MNVTSDEALQVLSTAHELGRAGRGELHARLAERGLGGEVVLGRGLEVKTRWPRWTRAAVPTFLPKAQRMP